MTRWRDRDTGVTENLQAIALAVVVCAAIALFVNAVATSDADNIGGAKHPGPVPAGVTQYSDDAYLVGAQAKVSENEICFGTDSGGDKFEDTKTMPDGSIYVECGDDQKWNYAATDDTNFGEAIVDTLDEPGWFAPVAGALALLLVYPAYCLLGSALAIPGDRKRRRAEERSDQEILTAKHRELVASWARNDIDDLAFEQKLDQLVRKGLKQ